MALSVLGLGTAVPEHTMTQEQALEMTSTIVCQDERQRRLLRVLFRKAAVKNRHTCVPHSIGYEWLKRERQDLGAQGTAAVTAWGPTTRERMELYRHHAAALAKRAVCRAFEEADLAPEDVTHLVTVSCTGFDAPGVDIELIDDLQLRPTTQRVNVGYMGCHGAINGLRVARGIAASQPGSVVLLSATELCSLHFRFNWDDEGIIGNALFADGSAALLIGDRPSRAPRRAYKLRATGSCLIPDSRDVMSWHVGDHGFEMKLSSAVAEKISGSLRPWISDWLGDYGLSVDSVGSWAVHPGGPRILQAVDEALDLPPEATEVSRQVLAEHGNMSSPTVLFILDRMHRANTARPCVALGFGPGLVAEAALFD